MNIINEKYISLARRMFPVLEKSHPFKMTSTSGWNDGGTDYTVYWRSYDERGRKQSYETTSSNWCIENLSCYKVTEKQQTRTLIK